MTRLKGFTLVEVLITITLLSIAMLAILRGNVFNLRSAKTASDLTAAVMAAESIMKEQIGKGFPESGLSDGEFEEEYFSGMKWYKRVETLNIPFVEDLKIVTVEVEYGNGRIYSLQTVMSQY
jgi:type II secretion system protein I